MLNCSVYFLFHLHIIAAEQHAASRGVTEEVDIWSEVEAGNEGERTVYREEAGQKTADSDGKDEERNEDLHELHWGAGYAGEKHIETAQKFYHQRRCKNNLHKLAHTLIHTCTHTHTAQFTFTWPSVMTVLGAALEN